MPQCIGITLKKVQCTRFTSNGTCCYQHKNQEKKETVFVSEECNICLEEMSEAQTLKCGHQYHKTCIKGWKKQSMTCPMCRAPIEGNRPLLTIDDIFESSLSVEEKIFYIELMVRGYQYIWAS